MATRTVTKIGDVFMVQVNEHQVKYFQLIAFDLLQLNSDVIRGFKETYTVKDLPPIDKIVDGEVEFYVHCVTKFGLKMNLWKKYGNSSNLGSLENILFRDTNDCGVKEGDLTIRISHNWYIWKLGDSDFSRVGKLIGENRKAEIGIIMDPISIFEKVKTGDYGGLYPDFD